MTATSGTSSPSACHPACRSIGSRNGRHAAASPQIEEQATIAGMIAITRERGCLALKSPWRPHPPTQVRLGTAALPGKQRNMLRVGRLTATTRYNIVVYVVARTSAMREWVAQLRKGLIELAVLGVLREGEAYGY